MKLQCQMGMPGIVSSTAGRMQDAAFSAVFSQIPIPLFSGVKIKVIEKYKNPLRLYGMAEGIGAYGWFYFFVSL